MSTFDNGVKWEVIIILSVLRCEMRGNELVLCCLICFVLNSEESLEKRPKCRMRNFVSGWIVKVSLRIHSIILCLYCAMLSIGGLRRSRRNFHGILIPSENLTRFHTSLYSV